MDQTIAISFVSSLVGGLVVAAANHFMTKRRDREQRKREFVLRFLVEAWQNLEEGSRNEIDIAHKARVLEKAVADIQLFGSAAQIELAKKFTEEMALKNSSDTTVMLQNLRDDLRRELSLEKSPSNLFFLRVTPKNPDDLKRYRER